jgi:hypothetical protein
LQAALGVLELPPLVLGSLSRRLAVLGAEKR